MLGPAAFDKMDRLFFPPGQPARVVCPQEPSRAGAVCKKAETVEACVPRGALALICEVPPAARALLGTP